VQNKIKVVWELFNWSDSCRPNACSAMRPGWQQASTILLISTISHIMQCMHTPGLQHPVWPGGQPSKYHNVFAPITSCVTSVNNWCASKRLQLNTKKTEVMWFASAINLRKISSVDKDSHSRRIRHHITIFCCPWSRSFIQLRTQHEVAY